ncbi:MAG: hypothetical protein ABI367_10330, partial [Mucilaginibacter sp.]
MSKYLRVLLCFISLPLFGICQTPSVPQWVADIGGPNASVAVSLNTTDSQNNIYVTGIFSGTVDFDPSPTGVKNITSVGGSIDVFVAKYTTNGTLVWAVSIGAAGTDQPNCIAIDNAGNLAISGQYDSPVLDADPGPGVSNLTNAGALDMFLLNLDNNGNFLWAKSIGSTGVDYGNNVTVDNSGNRILGGQFQSTIKVSGTSITANGSVDGLIAKYDATGNLLWTIHLGQTADNGVRGVLADTNGNIIVAGAFNGTINFNPLGTAYNLTANTDSYYIAKYSPAGQLIWLQPITGSIVGYTTNLGIDPSNNNIYVDGRFSSRLTFSTGTINPVGTQDIFLARYATDGTIQWVKDIGGSGASVFNNGIAAKNGEIYISGFFNGTADFDPSAAVSPISYHGQRDLFLAKYTDTGNYQWAIAVGNSNCNNTLGRSVNIDNDGNIVLGGAFCSTANFDVSNCTTYPVTAQSTIRDGFLAKYVPTLSGLSNNIITAPVVSTFCINGDPSLLNGTTPTGSNSIYTYQWQISADNITFSNIIGATSKDYDPPVINNTSYYRRIARSGTCLDVTSNVVTITINAAITNNVITAPTNNNLCSGADPDIINGTSPAGNVAYTYQWQSSTDNIVFTDIAGATAKDYDPPVLNVTIYYRRDVFLGGCSQTSNVITITINAQTSITNNTITAPIPAGFCANVNPGTIVGSTPSGGTGTYAYQWQTSTDNTNFTDIAGATAKDFNPPLSTLNLYYQRVVTSGNCATPQTSNTVLIIANSSSSLITSGAIITFCVTGDPDPIIGNLPTGGNGTYTYQWQSSTDNITFADIPGATAIDYDPTIITTTTYYRRTAFSGGCSELSNVVIISISPQSILTNNTITPPTVSDFCTSGDAAAITGTIATGSNAIVYQWQKSTDNVSFADIPGATLSDYDPAVLTATTYYRRIVQGGACAVPSTSNVVVINVSSPPVASAGNNVSICLNSSTVLNATGGTTY